MDTAGTFELLWGDPPGPRRGPKPALSHELIARTGIGIADADGLAAVSMQRVAAELGFTKMSLYRYVPGKAELVALMADLAMGTPPEDLHDGDWCDRLRTWALALLPGFLSHPWVLEVTTGPHVVGPNELAWMEAALAVLDGTGLPGVERMDVLAVLAGHVRSLAQQVAKTPGGDTGAQFGAVLAEVVFQRGDRYPHTRAVLAESIAGGDQDKALDFGLDLIVDGLRARVERARSSGDSTRR
ncbi:TetR/AcrR family transcriptional regulator [Saccharothrix sp. NRRL B-16314]|uniref:TetR/AcrR family transcriptional regulator n=1 Tax=Saccharothrix sp. NRRL B-16314 TaxID=1463825 RepID=UPI000527D9CB|nr:TetR/AcrR family transcriptional regulator [Saccharothrix sp. NRRL B-16314]